MLKKILPVAVALVLIALPLAVRWAYYYEGQYEPGEVVRPDLAEIVAPTPDLESFADRHRAASPGVILVDRGHANRFEMAELSVLQARLSARGQRLETVEAVEDLNEQLGEYFGVEDGEGALIAELDEDGSAYEAGLRAGDVITEMDEERIEDKGDVAELLADKDEGDEVKIEVLRKGSKKTS